MGVFRFSSWYVLFEGPNEKLGSPKSFLPKCPPSGNIVKQRNPLILDLLKGQKQGYINSKEKYAQPS